MKRDLKINFSVVDAIANEASQYSTAVESMIRAVNSANGILQTDSGEAVTELRALQKDLVKDLQKCYDTLGGLKDVFSGFSYDMQSYVRPVSSAQMVRVDRDDIWKNKQEIGQVCNRVAGLSGRYRWNISGTWDPFGEQSDSERRAEERNYTKITSILNSVIPSCAKKLQAEMELLHQIYDRKIIPFENTDDTYGKLAKELYNKYKDLKWYQQDWFKILVGVVIIAALIAATVLTGGAAAGTVMFFAHGILHGALMGALMGGAMGAGISGITAAATGGDIMSSMADGFMWGVVGGAISGASGAYFTNLGYLGTAVVGGAEDTVVYLFQQLYNGEEITAGGLLINFGMGALISVGTKYITSGKPKVGNASDSGKILNQVDDAASSGTGTVWDDIKPTQPNIEGTNIPKSFELGANGEKYWVNPNATKHMAEYSTRTLSHGQKITEQQLLSSLKGSVTQAAQNGFTYNVPVRVGNWELIFSPARQAGQLPVIKHALYIP